MTSDPGRERPVIFRIDGRNTKSANDFYREIGSAVNGPGGYFGRNLDAPTDCLRGGFGTPEDQPFAFEWPHSKLARRHLGGTLFNSIQQVFREAGVPLSLR